MFYLLFFQQPIEETKAASTKGTLEFLVLLVDYLWFSLPWHAWILRRCFLLSRLIKTYHQC